MSRSNAGQVPPTLTVSIPSLGDINPPNRRGKIPTQVVLLTVEDEEFLTCYAYMKNITKSFLGDLSWVYFGEMGDNSEGNVDVSLVRCLQGSTTPGAASTTVQSAIRALRPKAVVCLGYCRALNLQKVKLGDVVLSTKLATYSNTKVTSSGVEVRSTIQCISRRMKNLIMCVEHGWKAPFVGTQSWKAKVHCQAAIASGPQLVVDRKRREELLRLFPDAIAIEMEGEGVYSTCHELGVEWAVVKGISDYADDTKSQTANWKWFASAMAASVVNHMFREPEVLEAMPHYSEATSFQHQDVTKPSHGDEVMVETQKQLAVTTLGSSVSEPREFKWCQVSKVHRAKLNALAAILKTNPRNSTRIGTYRVCLEERFCIGQGSLNTRIYVGLSDDGREVAVKRLSLDLYNEIGENEAKILMEGNITKEKHVLTLFHYEVVNGYGYLILYLYEQTLEEYVASHKREELEKEGPQIIRQILLGLKTLHCGARQRILHRDLKPSNILVDADNDFFLSDFGISRIIAKTEETLRAVPIGTNGWMATESISEDDDAACHSNKQTNVRFKPESDIQVAGMLFFYILTGGRHPYGASWVDQCYNIKKGNPIDLDKYLVDLVAKDFITWMLQKDPKCRPSVEECLKHPFVRSRDEQFDLITRVGNQVEIKTKDATSPIILQLNCDPLVSQLWLPKPNWQSMIDTDVMNYICGKRKYSTDAADLLRFIRNTEEHWGDGIPPRIVAKMVEKPRNYFMKLFPALPAVLHNIIRNHSPSWKQRDQLRCFF